MTSRPFTPETLAERWLVSAETIRQLVHRGELRAFRVGRMIRIAQKDVEEFECQKSQSESFEADYASHGGATMDDGFAISLRHAPERKPRQKPAKSTSAPTNSRQG